MNDEQQDPDLIRIVWSVEDVAGQCAELEIELSLEEQCEVLRRMKRRHDANIGINWDVIDYHIGIVEYGRPHLVATG